MLAGVPVYQAEQAIALLREAGIPVNARKDANGRLPSCWLYVARVDAEKALALLAGHSFPASTVPEKETVVLQKTSGAAPGDDVWALLTQQEPPWPSTYSFP